MASLWLPNGVLVASSWLPSCECEKFFATKMPCEHHLCAMKILFISNGTLEFEQLFHIFFILNSILIETLLLSRCAQNFHGVLVASSWRPSCECLKSFVTKTPRGILLGAMKILFISGVTLECENLLLYSKLRHST